MRHPILQDAALNDRLAQEGYIIFPLLSPTEVTTLRDIYFAHHADAPARFYATTHVQDKAFRQRMSDAIRSILQPKLAPLFDQGELLGGAFIAKPKGNPGILPPHADWNLTDERTARSYNLWVPLVDTNPQNGAVHILPGSHTWFYSFRGPGIPNPFAPVMAEVWHHMVPLNMTAGQALLYDHRLVHASPVNQTDALRLACVAGVIPKGTPMRHYRLQDGNVHSYQATVEFFLEGNPETDIGNLQHLGIEAYSFPQLNMATLAAYIQGPPQPSPLRRFLRALGIKQ